MRTFWDDYSLLFQYMTNESEMSLDASLFRERTVPSYVAFEEVAKNETEPESVFKLVLNTSQQAAADSLERVTPSYAQLDSFTKAVKAASPARAKTVGLLVYYWLLYHKPKFIRDTMFHELEKIGAVNVSKGWKMLFLKWVELHQVIYERAMPHLDASMGTEDNPIFQLHNNFLKVLDMIASLIA
eukprot:TRINITY_DN5857_c0_g3_i2.p1 TRINITY_DN5857_c0_g3~~TRINITY_DN5857_c0_g3_i2.p1  ORF type:complete len:185 (+),score=33.77 TRINITY_DN5857_c0_g3_i2:1199-1753(+)